MITATLNPRWPEVIEHLKGSTSQLDAVIADRIFKERSKKLIAFIKAEMGGTAYMIYVIEFRKLDIHTHISF